MLAATQAASDGNIHILLTMITGRLLSKTIGNAHVCEVLLLATTVFLEEACVTKHELIPKQSGAGLTTRSIF